MDTEYLIQTQLHLECIRFNNQGYLLQFQCDNPDPIARLYIFRNGENYFRYLHADVPAILRQHLKLLPEIKIFEEIKLIQQTLAEHKPCDSVFRGKSYIFPEDALEIPFADNEIVYDGSNSEIWIDGEIAASCSSVRENATAAEAWVHTQETFRGQGLGRRVALAWARKITEKGKIAFYTHSVDNVASQKLVEKLPFVWCYDLVSYS